MNHSEIQRRNKGTLLFILVPLAICSIIATVIYFSDRKASEQELKFANVLCDQDSELLSYDEQKFAVTCADGTTYNIEGTIMVSELLNEKSPTFLEERIEVYARLNRVMHQARTIVGCEPKDAKCEDKLKAKDAEVEARFKAQFGVGI